MRSAVASLRARPQNAFSLLAGKSLNHRGEFAQVFTIHCTLRVVSKCLSQRSSCYAPSGNIVLRKMQLTSWFHGMQGDKDTAVCGFSQAFGVVWVT